MRKNGCWNLTDVDCRVQWWICYCCFYNWSTQYEKRRIIIKKKKKPFRCVFFNVKSLLKVSNKCCNRLNSFFSGFDRFIFILQFYSYIFLLRLLSSISFFSFIYQQTYCTSFCILYIFIFYHIYLYIIIPNNYVSLLWSWKVNWLNALRAKL